MPIVIRPRRTRSVALAAAVAALLLGVALPAVADAASCPSTPTTKAFSACGDTADYSLVSNGHFESGSGGWSLANSWVTDGNESYKVRNSADRKSLAIKSSGLVASPAFCVSDEHPSFRFFARRTSGNWGVLNVKLRWTEPSGRTRETLVGALSGNPFSSWLPSPSLPLATALPLWQGSSLNVRLVFDPEQDGGNWAMDDVYVDPYRR